MVRVGADISGFADSMKSVVSQASEAADKVADKLETLGDVGQRLAVLGGSLTAGITLPLEEVARRSIDVAGQFEQTRIAFTTLLGSASASRDMLAKLYDFAAKTPFELPQVLAGARQIMAFGFSSKDIIPIMRTVGDAIAGLGTGEVGMQRVLASLGKIKTAATVQSEEMNQLTDAGIASWQMLANAMGKTVPEVRKMVEKREISSETAINALLAGMNNQFGGMMVNQMDSFRGQMSNLKDQITLTADAIGQSLLPAGKVLLSWASVALEQVKNLAEWFKQLPAPIQASAIAIAGLAAAAGPALVALGGFMMVLPHIASGVAALAAFGTQIGGAITGVAQYVSTLAAMASEYGVAATASFAFGEGLATVGGLLVSWPVLIAAAVVGLVALSTWVYTHWAGVKAFLYQVFDGIGDAWNASLGKVLNWLNGVMGGSANDLIAIWTGFKDVFVSIWEAVSGVFHRAFDGFKHDLDDLVKLMEKNIPGFKKIETAGDAFSKAESDKKDKDSLKEAKQDLLGGGTAPRLHNAMLDWDETQKGKISKATDELKVLKENMDKGRLSAEDFAKAMARVDGLKSEKNPYRVSAATSSRSGSKVDHNALDGLSGEHAQEESQLARQRAQIEHDYQMAKPGSATRKDESAEDQAKADIAAAEKRKAALDATYEDERQKTLKNLADKLALYKADQNGHASLIQAKTAAEERYKTAIQKTTFDLENVKKQSLDRIQAAENKQHEDEEKAQQKSFEMAVKTMDLNAKRMDKDAQFQIRQEQFNAGLKDKQLQFELETGELSKQQYLRLKQEQYDKAYEMEMQALEDERDAIEAGFADLMDKAKTADQRAQARADRKDKIGTLNDRQQQVENRHTGQTQDTKLGIERDRIGTMDKNFFTPFENGFSRGISNMVKGIQTFKQAWSSMMTSMLSQWIDHVAQMVAQWVTAKLRELVIHATTNQAKVASDRVAALQSKQISVTQHMHEVMLAAKLAAAKTWAAVSGIPVIGPILAPVAAAAAFAGVFAISAESGAVLPNHNTVGFLHPQEMVLPKGISVGLQNLIASGGLSNADGIMNQAQGGTMSSTALQMMRNTAAADIGDTHHNYHGPMHYHAAPGEAMNVDTFGKMFKTYVRQNNYKMA